MKDDLRYVPADCFETFPFPPNWEHNQELEATGKTYYEFRAALMIRNNEGLTKTYNRFHDPNESDPDITTLRELHAAMDRAVLDAYGFVDIQPTCEFLLDYEEADEEESPSARRKKKPWRYRWPDEVRDEVLARLLDLNAQRAKADLTPTKPVLTPGAAVLTPPAPLSNSASLRGEGGARTSFRRPLSTSGVAAKLERGAGGVRSGVRKERNRQRKSVRHAQRKTRPRKNRKKSCSRKRSEGLDPVRTELSGLGVRSRGYSAISDEPGHVMPTC